MSAVSASREAAARAKAEESLDFFCEEGVPLKEKQGRRASWSISSLSSKKIHSSQTTSSFLASWSKTFLKKQAENNEPELVESTFETHLRPDVALPAPWSTFESDEYTQPAVVYIKQKRDRSNPATRNNNNRLASLRIKPRSASLPPPPSSRKNDDLHNFVLTVKCLDDGRLHDVSKQSGGLVLPDTDRISEPSQFFFARGIKSLPAASSAASITRRYSSSMYTERSLSFGSGALPPASLRRSSA